MSAEQRLKRGELKVLVATASLELGIDIGDVDLVCQIGSTRSINAFLQRVGRAGHSVGGISKGRLFSCPATSSWECAALLDAVRRGELITSTFPQNRWTSWRNRSWLRCPRASGAKMRCSN